MSRFFALLCLCFVVSTLALNSYDVSTPWPKHLYDAYRAPWKLVRNAVREPVTFWVALKQRNLDQLDKLFEAVTNPRSPQYTNYPSLNELMDIIAPPVDVQQTVEKWLRSAGGVKKLINYRDAFEVVMTGKAATKLFKTQFYLFEHEESKAQRVRQVSGFVVPEYIKQHIDFVSGLTDFPYVRPKKFNTTGSPDASYKFVIPQTIRNVYDIPAGTVTKNPQTKQTVIEFSPVGGPYFSDLVSFASKSAEIFTNLTEIIGPYYQGSNDGESVLDVELITNVAPKAFTQYITLADGWAFEMALFVNNLADATPVNSVSYGWPEVYSCQSSITHAHCNGSDTQGYVNRGNIEFQKSATLGIGFYIATQDEGAPSEANMYCQYDNTQTPVYSIYPSASPYVTAVSGTTIVEDSTRSVHADPPICGGSYPCAHGKTEVPCSVENTYYQWTTGGGFSNWGVRPSYQADFVAKYLSSGAIMPPTDKFPSTMRGYGDVSAVGARILTVSSGAIMPSAGTSASTPIVAGIATLLNDRRLNAGKKPLGFINPLLYQMAKDRPNAFHDITVGHNRCTLGGTCCKYGYGATTGWDPVTGLGTFSFTNAAAYIDNLP
jgi:tripeptidyl-peptidase-1